MKKLTLVVSGFALAVALSPVVSQTTRTAAAHATGKPQLGRFGVDESGMDKRVAPGDDFYRYVNGAWNDRTEIPADKSSWGGFGVLRDLSDQRTRAVIEDVTRQKNAPGSLSDKIGTTYAAFMDQAAIEARGAAPLKPYLAQITAIATRHDLAHAMAMMNRRGLRTAIGLGVGQDPVDNSEYTVYAGQGGLGMPDRDYYLKDDAKSVETRAKYVTHIAKMMRLAGQPDPEGSAERIFAFEKSLAQVHWSRAEQRQVEKTYNPTQAGKLSEKMPGFDWATYVTDAGLGAQPIVVLRQPSALTATAKILGATPMPVVREYLTYHMVEHAAPLLSTPFVNENFAFYGTTLSGTPQLKARWKRGVDLVNGSLGEAVGEVYVQRYFTARGQGQGRRAGSQSDRRDGHSSVEPGVDGAGDQGEGACPSWPRLRRRSATPRSGGTIPHCRSSRAIRSVTMSASRSSSTTASLNKIGKPVDRTEWGMTPQTVNAYANPLLNEVVFPAAILQPPFFDPNADPAVNYGAIGAVIGHELSHHFDDQGRKFDPAREFQRVVDPAGRRAVQGLYRQGRRSVRRLRAGVGTARQR